MDSLYNTLGGGRIGWSFWLSVHASWPFSKIEVYPDRLVVRIIFKSRILNKADITGLQTYRLGPWLGLEIKHSIASIPKFIVFSPGRYTGLFGAYDGLVTALTQAGYSLSD